MHLFVSEYNNSELINMLTTKCKLYVQRKLKIHPINGKINFIGFLFEQSNFIGFVFEQPHENDNVHMSRCEHHLSEY